MNKYDMKYSVTNENTQTSIFFNPRGKNNTEDIKLILDDVENIDIYPTNEDINSYQLITEYVYYGFVSKSNFLCKGLNQKYILDSFHECDAVITIGGLNNILPNGNIFAFALINFEDKNNSIYVHVICSHSGIRGAGGLLLNEIEKIAKQTLFTKIYLNSVKSAITFYQKQGFKLQDKNCENDCLMKKQITYGGKKTRKNIHKTNKLIPLKIKTARRRRVSFRPLKI